MRDGLARSTWTPRSTSSSERALDGPLLPLIRRLNEIRREQPGAAARSTTSPSSRPRTTALIAYAKRCRRQHADRRRQPRSRATPQEGVVDRAQPSSACRPSFAVERPAHRASASTGASGRNYVRLDPHGRPDPRAASGLLRRDPQRSRPLVRVRPALVQDRDLLRDPPARLLRRQRRRLRRLPRPDREARLPAVARHRLHLAAADVPVAAARRRLRHRRLLRRSTPTTARSTTSATSSRPPTSAASA